MPWLITPSKKIKHSSGGARTANASETGRASWGESRLLYESGTEFFGRCSRPFTWLVDLVVPIRQR